MKGVKYMVMDGNQTFGGNHFVMNNRCQLILLYNRNVHNSTCQFYLHHKIKTAFFMLWHTSEEKRKKNTECDNALFLPDNTCIASLCPYQPIYGSILQLDIQWPRVIPKYAKNYQTVRMCVLCISTFAFWCIFYFIFVVVCVSVANFA